MSKANKKRLVLLCTGVAMLIVSIVFSCILSTHGKEYTKEYQIHLALLELDNVQDVEAYLTENNISYSINNSTLTLNNYENIEYFIRTDNSTGYLIPSEKFLYLAKLDAKDYEIVTVEKEPSNDGYDELIFLKHKGITYSKFNGSYFIETTRALKTIQVISTIAYILIGVYLVLDYLELYFNMLKNRAASKSPKKNDSDIYNY